MIAFRCHRPLLDHPRPEALIQFLHGHPEFLQVCHVPVRSVIVRRRQVFGKIVPFPQHLRAVAGMFVPVFVFVAGRVHGGAFRIGAPEDPVVSGITVHDPAARFQHPHHFPVRRSRIRQGPGDIPGEDEIECRIRKSHVLGIHAQEFNAVDAALPGCFRRHCRHFLRIVNAGYFTARFPQDHCREPRPAAQVQGPDDLLFRQALCDLVPPGFICRQVPFFHGLIAELHRPHGPVSVDSVLDIHFVPSRWRRYASLLMAGVKFALIASTSSGWSSSSVTVPTTMSAGTAYTSRSSMTHMLRPWQ